MAEPVGRQGERGVALLIAILAVSLLTVTLMEFTFTTQVGLRRTAHWRDARRAQLLAQSGVALVAEVLALDARIGATVEENLAAAEAATGRPPLELRAATVDGLVPTWDRWAGCVEPTPWTCNAHVEPTCTVPLSLISALPGFGELGSNRDEDVSVRIQDEVGLYNLNRASRHPVQGEYDRVARLLALAGLDASLAGPIVDWVDPDIIPLSYPPGAEEAQYQSAERTTMPRNAPLRTFRELSLVMGVGPRELARLRGFATVLDIDVDHVNVNTAPLPVLQSLVPDADEAALLALHTERCVRPFVDADDLLTRVPEIGRSGIQPLLCFKSDRFRVRATARVGEVFQSVEVVLKRTGDKTSVEYFLSQPGPNIVGIDSSEAPSFDELSTFVRSFARRD